MSQSMIVQKLPSYDHAVSLVTT